MMRYIFAAAVIVLLIQIEYDLRSFEDSMITWRCNQTGLCHGVDKAQRGW